MNLFLSDPYQQTGPTGMIIDHAAEKHHRKDLMLDVIMIGVALGFFALSIGYTFACDWL